MPLDHREFTEDIAVTLACYYALAGAINGIAAWRGARLPGAVRLRAGAWLLLAGLFSMASVQTWQAHPPDLPQSFEAAIDSALGPVTLFFGSLALLTAFYLWRGFFVRRWVAWTFFNGAIGLLGLSLSDPNFAHVVLKPDNVPIVGLVFLLGVFTWWGAAQAVENDARHACGQPPSETLDRETTFVWPDLVYIELICMVVLAAGLIAWSLLARAPLEQPANAQLTPNPSKAPWYFCGLQELLVYFDPSIAGVILPGLIIFGLAAIPYLDRDPKGSGYYTIAQRRCGYIIFLFGFLQLWILLILVGTFLRGPNWTFFGPYEPRDLHKLTVLNNVKLSEVFWVTWLGHGLPQAPIGAGVFGRFGWIAWREIAGIAALAFYFLVLPPVLGRTLLKRLRRRTGAARYAIMILLLLMMLAVPLKMFFHWSCNLSYLVSMPEYFFNF